jgi:Na+-transporting methylmalonyl-CoA/oxaloacetate decarboxylase gamma subunit
MKIKILLLFFYSVFFFSVNNIVYAQGDRIIKINEFLVLYETNYVDDYGNHSSWIELFNPAYNPVNISRMYITNDPNNPTKYRIPNVDYITVIQPRSFLIIFADNKSNRGVFHVNFLLNETGYIGIYDSDGKTLMDEIYYPKQKIDTTYGRVEDGIEKWNFLEKSTPNSSNVIEVGETTAEMFGRLDPFGFALTIISMSVVFGGLILLFFAYKYIGVLNQKKFTFKAKQKNIKTKEIENNETPISVDVVLSGEVNAAIAMGLNLFITQNHDYENAIVTIKKISKPYSPWNSKIYGLRNNPKNRL